MRVLLTNTYQKILHDIGHHLTFVTQINYGNNYGYCNTLPEKKEELLKSWKYVNEDERSF